MACGLVNGGQAYCWGDNSFGALGVGQTDHVTVPAAVLGGITYQLSRHVVPGPSKTVRR